MSENCSWEGTKFRILKITIFCVITNYFTESEFNLKLKWITFQVEAF